MLRLLGFTTLSCIMADIVFDPIHLDSRLETRLKRFLTLIHTLGDPWARVRALTTKWVG